MHAAHDLIREAVAHTQEALERMPIRSSALARQMLKEGLPMPETSQDIERYVHELLVSVPQS